MARKKMYGKDMQTVSYYLTCEQVAWLKDMADYNGCSESHLLRLALEKFIELIEEGADA